MPTITCVGRDGIQRIFRYEVERNEIDDLWDIRVFADPLPTSGNFFHLAVSSVDDTEVQVIAIAHNNEPAYMARGIPDALLPAVKTALGKEVISSPTVGRSGVFRTPAATKYWERMRTCGRAAYDSLRDVYKVT